MRWIGLTIIAVLAGLIAWASASYSYARIAPGPEFTMAPLSRAHAPLRYAGRRLPPDMKGVDTKALAALARRSIESEPLNPRGLRMLALDARARKQPEQTQSFAAMSQRLSRRDGTTQMMLIENLVTQPGAKVSDILRHYDLALHVNPQLRERFFPPLIQVIAAEEARAELVPYVKKQRHWPAGMMNAALNTDHGPAAVADILLRTFPDKPITMPDGLSSQRLIGRLLARQEYDLAQEFFRKMEGSDAKWLSSTDFGLAAKQRQFGALAWELKTTADAGAEIVAEQGPQAKYAMQIFAQSGANAKPVRRVAYFPAGSYELEAEIEALDVAETASIGISLKCLAAGAPKRTLAVLNHDVSRVGADGQATPVTIPKDCSAQEIVVEVYGGDRQTGLELLLKTLRLTPQ